MLPYGRQSVSEDDVEAVAAVLRGDWLTTGPAVDAFEAAVSAATGGHRGGQRHLGHRRAAHCHTRAAGVGPGDEVVTTPMTFVATASGASILGATVRFADVDPESGLLDPARSRRARQRPHPRRRRGRLRRPSRATTPGCRRSRTGSVRPTLADAAHSIGGTLDGRPVGDLADITTFSFFPDQEPDHCRGRRGHGEGPGSGPAGPRVPQHRPGPRPDRFRCATRGRGTRRCTRSGSTTGSPTSGARWG